MLYECDVLEKIERVKKDMELMVKEAEEIICLLSTVASLNCIKTQNCISQDSFEKLNKTLLNLFEEFYWKQCKTKARIVVKFEGKHKPLCKEFILTANTIKKDFLKSYFFKSFTKSIESTARHLSSVKKPNKISEVDLQLSASPEMRSFPRWVDAQRALEQHQAELRSDEWKRNFGAGSLRLKFILREVEGLGREVERSRPREMIGGEMRRELVELIGKEVAHINAAITSLSKRRAAQGQAVVSKKAKFE